MPSQPFNPKELKDALLQFDLGVNHGIAPELVPRNQVADSMNASVRGDFIHPRSYYRKRYLEFPDPSIVAAMNAGWVQGGCRFKPDAGLECLMFSIGGRLYQFEIHPDKAIVTDVTIAGGQTPTATQCWLWQSEKWVVWNDGVLNPIFWRPNGGNRSNYGTALPFSTWPTVAFVVPAIGSTVNVTLNSVANLVVGDIITVQNRGLFSVQDLPGGFVATLLNITATPVGQTVPASAGPASFFWSHFGVNLPPGRMGTYGLGRNWMALTDGKQFVASDAVGGSSGTLANNFRDAPLNITENLYLAGGGAFTVPGNPGEIRAMRFASTLDASLGQGPLQVFTPTTVFSCIAPPDRLTWQDVTNPIVTESLIANGGLGQDSTIAANGDTIMRSIEGLRSLVLARREFATWGNTPISHEVDPIFQQDSQDLLPWGSAVVFDNRFLMTAGTVLGEHGPYFRGLVPLNFDPLSTIAGKAPSVYDSRLWTGLNGYKILSGLFAGIDRCFILGRDLTVDALDIYEVLPEESGAIGDNQDQRVTWFFESGTLYFGQKDPTERDYKRLMPAEIWVDDLRGQVDFFAWWKPDQWPCWVPWASWSECSKETKNSNTPQFRPRMGLPEPSSTHCDTILNRPLREGYTFRFKLQITGHCTFKGAKFTAVTIPEPRFAQPVCEAICQS